ncbi:MAG: DUF4402 domain-containing protein [Burkholderiaceae bacterium]|nr:DUF4402 domain-containing protein [Burkholderiaceae bacterium]
MFIRLNKLSRQMTIASGLALASVSSAFAASDNANATATVIAPITIVKASDLLFGNIIAGAGGTISVDAADSVSLGGGVTVPPTQTGTRAAAVFNVTGEGTNTYAITLPSTDQTITHTDTVTTMLANAFVSNPSGTGALTAGAQTLKVGATLNVASAQLAGVYSGTFSVTVDYN